MFTFSFFRSNGFFDGQPKFDFPKPDFGANDISKPALSGGNWDKVYNGMTNNIDSNIRVMADTAEEYNPHEGGQAEGNEEQQGDGDSGGNQQVIFENIKSSFFSISQKPF